MVALPRFEPKLDHGFPAWHFVAGYISQTGIHSAAMFNWIGANEFYLDKPSPFLKADTTNHASR